MSSGASERLIFIAGVSCVGKSTLFDAIRDDRAGMLASQLALDPRAPFRLREAWEWNDGSDPVIPEHTTIMHYDLFRPLSMPFEKYRDDPALRPMKYYREVHAVTLWETPDTLLHRAKIRKREIWRELLASRDWSLFSKRRRRRNKMQAHYQAKALWKIYRDWFDFCRQSGISKHWLLQPSEGSLIEVGAPEKFVFPFADVHEIDPNVSRPTSADRLASPDP